MAGELVAQLPARVWDRAMASGYQAAHHAVLSGDLAGLRLNKLAIDPYVATVTIPGNLTMATGLTFYFMLVDNGEFAADPGLVVRLGIQVKRLISGETTALATAAGTEQTVDITTQSTAGQVTVASLAVAAANLDSAAVGDIIGIRLRRVSTATQDTFTGSINLLHVFVKNT